VPNRIFTRDQLDEWGVPHDLPEEEHAADYPDAAIELHREQTGSRRWVSVHKLIFRAPDDGKAYRVTFEVGLTEEQEDHDPWADEDTVTGVEVEQRTETVTRWKPVSSRPAVEQ
jgi:hypothetical protein